MARKSTAAHTGIAKRMLKTCQNLIRSQADVYSLLADKGVQNFIGPKE